MNTVMDPRIFHWNNCTMKMPTFILVMKLLVIPVSHNMAAYRAEASHELSAPAPKACEVHPEWPLTCSSHYPRSASTQS